MSTNSSIHCFNRNIKCINLSDRPDRLGANITWYLSIILVAIKNKYKIRFIKLKQHYNYYNSIFVESLFDFVENYNEIHFENTTEDENIINENDKF